MKSKLEHTQIKTNGVSLHVVQAGPPGGPIAMLLHGFPEFWMAWSNQIDDLVASGYRVWIPDQRGYNTSDKPRAVEAYRIDVLVDDICGLIDAAGREKVLLCGHDWGGAVAWRLANKYPEKVEGLVIANSPHFHAMARYLKSNVRQMLRSWYMFFFQLPRLPEYALSRNDFAKLVAVLCASSKEGSFSESELQDYRAAWTQRGALTGMLNWYRALFRRQAAFKGNPRIAVPTLLIWGAKDHVFERSLAQSSIDLCDQGELVFVEEAGHWLLHEEAEKVNHLIGKFLAQLKGAAEAPRRISSVAH